MWEERLGVQGARLPCLSGVQGEEGTAELGGGRLGLFTSYLKEDTMSESDNYRKFVQGYIKLCEETGLYFDLTSTDLIGVFKLDCDDNQECFAKQIEELKGEGE